MRVMKNMFLLVAALVLSACGGGGGGGGSSDATAPPGGNGASPGQFTVVTTVSPGGVISPESVTVDSGQSLAFTLTPDTGYSLESVAGCDGTLDGSTYTTGPIVSPCEVNAIFSLNSYEVTGAAGVGGGITPESLLVQHGSVVEFTLTPETGFLIEAVTGCGGTLDDNTYTTAVITAPCEVNASFSTVAKLLDGEYRGVMRSPKNVFFTDGASLTFAIDGFDAGITKESFFGGRTCLLDGALVGTQFPLTGSGTFKCSDFTEGTWSSGKIAKTNATASISEIEMAAGSDVYTIEIAGFRGGAVSNYDPALDFWMKDADLPQFEGNYRGRLQSLDECAVLTALSSTTDLSIAISGGVIALEQDSLIEGVCRFQGGIDNFEVGVIAASGDYECSNFDTGTWSTDRLVMTGDDSMFAELLVDVPSRGCAYTVKYLGFKAASGPPGSPGSPGPVEPVEPASLSLESCDLFGCQTVSLPFNQVTSASLTVVPTPEWYTLGEFRLSVGPEDIVISNIRAEVVSGAADAARILGLTEGVLTAGSQLVFELQSAPSTTSSTIEFAFDIDLVPGIPSTFVSSVTVVTN